MEVERIVPWQGFLAIFCFLVFGLGPNLRFGSGANALKDAWQHPVGDPSSGEDSFEKLRQHSRVPELEEGIVLDYALKQADSLDRKMSTKTSGEDSYERYKSNPEHSYPDTQMGSKDFSQRMNVDQANENKDRQGLHGESIYGELQGITGDTGENFVKKDAFHSESPNRPCADEKECQRKYLNPDMTCEEGQCLEKKCKKNKHCPQGTACIVGNCVEVAVGREKHCSAERRCPEYHVCYVARNLCIAEDCYGQDECPGDMQCVSGRCTGAACKADRECPHNRDCIADHCGPPKPNEKMARVFRTTDKKCKKHSDCGRNEDICYKEKEDNPRKKRRKFRKKRCRRVLCRESENCPKNTACHEDLRSKYCSDLVCHKDEDCFSKKNCITGQKCAQLQVCLEGRCVLSAKCDGDGDCNEGQVCYKSICSKLYCQDHKQCPNKNKCDKERGTCRNTHCQTGADCRSGEKCQHRRCVSRSGGRCERHLDCPEREVCHGVSVGAGAEAGAGTKESSSPPSSPPPPSEGASVGQCVRRRCKHDKDCPAPSLACHPEGVCTAHLDSLDGMQIAEGMKSAKSGSLLSKPKSYKLKMPVSGNALKEEVDRFYAEVKQTFPTRDEAERAADKLYEQLERSSLRDTCEGDVCEAGQSRGLGLDGKYDVLGHGGGVLSDEEEEDGGFGRDSESQSESESESDSYYDTSSAAESLEKMVREFEPRRNRESEGIDARDSSEAYQYNSEESDEEGEEEDGDYYGEDYRLNRKGRRGRGRRRWKRQIVIGGRRDRRRFRGKGKGKRRGKGKGKNRNRRGKNRRRGKGKGKGKGKRPGTQRLSQAARRGPDGSSFDPLRRLLNGPQFLQAAAQDGDIILDVGERLTKKFRLNRVQAGIGLAKQKVPNCYWTANTTNNRLEYVPGCRPQAFQAKNWGNPRLYRTHSGVCNNLNRRREHYGVFGIPFGRLIKADFHNGLSKFRRSKFDGKALPNPRTLSYKMASLLTRLIGRRRKLDPVANANFVYFAQFVDHDVSNSFVRPITATTPVFGPAHSAANSLIPNCCGPRPNGQPQNSTSTTWLRGNSQSRRICIPIRLFRNDPYWRQRGPGFKRDCLHQQTTLGFPPFDCNLGPRQIMNQVTAWLDLSQIYNSKRDYFRLLNGNTNNSKLRTSAGNFLPTCFTTQAPAGTPPNSCPSCLFSPNRGTASRANCYIGGDFRTDENIALTLHQTIWMRNHNKIVDKLKSNPAWAGVDEETIYQGARRINIATYQHIIYNEFLPILIGRQNMRKFKLKPTRTYSHQYSPRLKPTVHNVFATATFRFGHAMIPDRIPHVDNNIRLDNTSGIGALDPNDLVFRYELFQRKNFLATLARGMMVTRAARLDGLFSKYAREIFNPDPPSFPVQTNSGGFDLMAWNINRGRDHGLTGFHMFVKLATGRDVKGWTFFRRNLLYGRQVVQMLRRIYKSWKDLDLYLLGLLEKPSLRNGKRTHVLPPTHAAIAGSTFARLKRADRFFYDTSNRNVRFRPRELREILQKSRYSRILCDNLDSDAPKGQPMKILPYAFRQRGARNQFITCNRIPQMNFNVFSPLPRQLAGRKKRRKKKK